jgi:hypothetical protein
MFVKGVDPLPKKTRRGGEYRNLTAKGKPEIITGWRTIGEEGRACKR